MAKRVRKESQEKNPDEELLSRIRKRSSYALERQRENRDRQREDTRLVYEVGSSWDERERNRRLNAGDPCMSFPQHRQFVHQVVNEQRQNRPGIRIHPASGEASQETADILQGLIRGIEYDSRAEAVYDCGYQHTVAGGSGYWRVISEYESPTSFNQKLVIKRLPDPMACWGDPDFTDPDGGDREYFFIGESIPEEEYKRLYPDAPLDSADLDGEWRPQEGQILVADYYERECEKRTLCSYEDGTTGYADDPANAGKAKAIGEDGKPVEREVNVYRVRWYKVGGGLKILARFDWPGQIIPVIQSMGDEVFLDGKRMLYSLVHGSKDTATLFDLGMSQQAVYLMTAPRSPWAAPVEAIAGYEDIWRKANLENYSFLPYRAFDKEGKPLPAPKRLAGTTPDAGWINFGQQMMGLMRSTIGMYEASLGMRSAETSGVAIGRKEAQADNATFHFVDNFSRAVALTGRILVECIPAYYDTERLVNTVMPDGTHKMQSINQFAVQMTQGAVQAIKMNDVSRGTYAVAVEAGPGYATKKQEAAQATVELVKAFPQMMQVAGDLVVGLQDFPDSDQFVKRMKFLLPPPVQQWLAAEEAGQNPEVAKLNAQLQDMGRQLQQMQQQMAAAAQENEQLKRDRSSSIAANEAKVAQAHAGIQNDAMNAQNERLRIMEESAAKRDELMVELAKAVIQAQAQPAQVMGAQQASTAAIEANP